MAQFARPNSDITLGSWQDDGGGATNIYLALDEASASDTDFVTGDNNTNDDDDNTELRHSDWSLWPSDDAYVTALFRQTIDLIELPTATHFQIDLLRDDGAAVYLNGIELLRDGLPQDADYLTEASTVASDDGRGFNTFLVDINELSENPLRLGPNVVAVELHNRIGSGDMSFNLRMETARGGYIPGAADDEYVSPENGVLTVNAQAGVLINDEDPDSAGLTASLLEDVKYGTLDLAADGSFVYQPNHKCVGSDSFTYVVNDGGNDSRPATVIIQIDADTHVPRASVWRFSDDGSDLGTAWREFDFDDRLWMSGRAQLGQGDGDETTETNDAGVTTYFRHTFDLSSHAADVAQLEVDLLRDAGAAVYLNGIEIVRDNLVPAADFATGATNPVTGADETNFHTFVIDASTLPPNTLRAGANVLAVEVHRFIGLDDLSFDLELQIDRVNCHPLALDDKYIIPEDGWTQQLRKGVLANDHDVDSDVLSATLIRDVQHGSLTLRDDGSFTYHPNTDFSGTDSFTYVADDGNLNSNLATATIIMLPRNDAPILQPGSPERALGAGGELTVALSSFINAGPNSATVTDLDGDVLGGIAITESTGSGLWFYSLDGRQFAEVGPVTPLEALLLPADAFLRYAASAGGDPFASVTYRAWDASRGTSGERTGAASGGQLSTYSAETDVLTIIEPGSLTVESILLNDELTDPLDLPVGNQPTGWSQQRSQLRSMAVNFSLPVLIAADDLVLTNLGINPDVDEARVVVLTNEQVTVAANVLNLTFSAGELEAGVFQLEILPSATDVLGNPLDGNGDGNGGDAYKTRGDTVNRLYVLPGDFNGDGGVSIFDFSTFAYWFGRSLPEAPSYVDLNGDLGVSIFDFPTFATQFGASVAFPQPLWVTRGSSAALRPAGESNFPESSEFAEHDASLLEVLVSWTRRRHA